MLLDVLVWYIYGVNALRRSVQRRSFELEGGMRGDAEKWFVSFWNRTGYKE